MGVVVVALLCAAHVGIRDGPTLHRPSAVGVRHAHARRRVLPAMSAFASNATDSVSELDEPRAWGLQLKGDKQHADGRDQLPYTLTCIGPPERDLGTFRLDPLTHCGDSLWVNEKQYVVKKVTFCYKLSNGRYKMVSKAAKCKEKKRLSLEKALEQMYKADSVPGIELDDE